MQTPRVPRHHAQKQLGVSHTGNAQEALLQEKCLALVAVQRNYDVLSSVMQQKQQELDQLHKNYDEESRKAVSLGVKLEDALARAKRAEMGASRLGPLEAQLADLEQRNIKLSTDLQESLSQAAFNHARVQSLQKAAEDNEFKSASVRREANAWQNSVAEAKEFRRKAAEQLDVANWEIKALKQELKDVRESSQQLIEKRQAAEARVSELELRLQNRGEQDAALQDKIRYLTDELHDSVSAYKALQVNHQASQQQSKIAEEQLESMFRSLTLAGNNQRAAEKEVAGLQEKLASAQATIRERDDTINKMQLLAADAEDRFRVLMMKGMEETESLARLNMQIAQSKALATAAQEELAQARIDHDKSLSDAKLATAAAHQHAAELSARNADNHRKHAKYLESLIAHVDRVTHSVSTWQAEAGRKLGEFGQTQERSLYVLACRLQKMESQWAQVEDVVAVIDGTTQGLSSLLNKQAFKKVSAADTANQKIATLEGLLATEEASKSTLLQERNRQEMAHREAVQEMQRVADERLESERQRLDLRLVTVEAGVTKLRVACEAEHREALRALELERKQMDKEMDELRAQKDAQDKEMAKLAKEMQSAGNQEMGALNVRHMEELERLKQDHQEEVDRMQVKVKSLQDAVLAAWDTGHLLSSDMSALCKHLTKMKWEIYTLEKGEMPDKEAEDGSGTQLVKASTILRLQFSHITEAVQNIVKKVASQPPPAPVQLPPPPPLPVAPPASLEQTEKWKALAKELRATVQTLVHVEDALASNCTCMLCLEVLKQPTTCPEGHTYCKSCFEERDLVCDECGGVQVTHTVANTALEAICSKMEFKQQALQQALSSLNSLN